jgi:hypothetical protein
MPISKERRRRYYVPGLPEDTHNLCPIRGNSNVDQLMTSLHFLSKALLVADIHAAHTLTQHGDVPDKPPPRSMDT